MIRFVVETTDPTTQQSRQLPLPVSDFVDRANEVLRDRLASIADEDVSVVWERIENHGTDGWSADVKIDLDGHSFGQQLWLDQYRDRRDLGVTLRDLVAEFGARVSEGTRKDLRRIRGELRDLNREGA